MQTARTCQESSSTEAAQRLTAEPGLERGRRVSSHDRANCCDVAFFCLPIVNFGPRATCFLLQLLPFAVFLRTRRAEQAAAVACLRALVYLHIVSSILSII